MGNLASRFTPRATHWTAIALLIALTEAIYIRPAFLLGAAGLYGGDFVLLHIRRIAFAQSYLFGTLHNLPGWYPHEFLGTPFSANLQNFPLIPTRLPLLLLDPELVFFYAVVIASALTAVFSYLYCRRIGLSEIGSAAAAWTFASAGFFVTRITAGHLPLLEAYPSLPLLLWLADRAISPDRARYQARDLFAIALASACFALAGHPQIPIYSLAASAAYIVFRSRGWHRVRILSAMALGAGTTLFAWVPMLLLIRRSFRVLHLAPPGNDIVMPYRRLLALVIPGIDGWPDNVARPNDRMFEGYPNFAYYWDTASYIGLLPLAAVLFLAIQLIVQKRLPRWPWIFLAALGAGSLLFALPLANPVRQLIPGTLLRSPSRLLYLSSLPAAIGLGVAIDNLLRSPLFKPRVRQLVVAGLLLFHLIDLGGFSTRFIHAWGTPVAKPDIEEVLSRETGDGRVAIEWGFKPVFDDRYSDVGVFDSILLANPYRAILALNGSPRDTNVQDIDGAHLSIPALQAAGTRLVVSEEQREDLELVRASEDMYVQRVPDPAPRAALFAERAVEFLPADKILDQFVSQPRAPRLLLPLEARRIDVTAENDGQNTIQYLRPSSDEIRLETSTVQPAFAHILECYDPGWTADIDDKPAPIVLANSFTMAVPVTSGKHVIRLQYHTPGRTLGWILSLISATLLVALIWERSRRHTRV